MRPPRRTFLKIKYKAKILLLGLLGVKPAYSGIRIPELPGNSLKLNLGCGHNYIDGFLNIDSSGTKCDLSCNLADDSFPIETASADYILASHVIEHLPSLVHFLNECHRVLKSGGIADLVTPLPCNEFWRDPTHIRPYTASTFDIYATMPKDSPHAAYLGLEPWSKCKTMTQREDFGGDYIPILYVRLTK